GASLPANPAPQPPPRGGEGEQKLFLPLSASGRGPGGGVDTPLATIQRATVFFIFLHLESCVGDSGGVNIGEGLLRSERTPGRPVASSSSAIRGGCVIRSPQ